MPLSMQRNPLSKNKSECNVIFDFNHLWSIFTVLDWGFLFDYSDSKKTWFRHRNQPHSKSPIERSRAFNILI